jgi:hypothetical protein
MIAERLAYLSRSDATSLEENSARVGQLLNRVIRHFRESGSPESTADGA